MTNKINFIKLVRVWGAIFLVVLGGSFIAMDAIETYRDFDLRAEKIRADFSRRQKQIIKQEVMRVVERIRYEQSQSETVTREKIKARVDEAYAIARHIYQQNRHLKSRTDIQRMILDALRPIRFENGSGYYFATRLDGIEMLFADRPEMEGLNLLNLKDPQGQLVIKDMIEIAKRSGEGFYEYHWTKPGSAGNDHKKIAFIKRFEPYDWIIGTGLYVNEVQKQIETDLLSGISRIRFGKEGYIFINRLNGDALVSNGKIFSGKKKLWEVFNANPDKMKAIFEKEHRAAMTPGGDYIYYSHIKLSKPDREAPKVSFIFGIPELRWLVGAGVYLDDVETEIALLQAELNSQVKIKIGYFVLIVMFIVTIFSFLFKWLSDKLQSDLNYFISFFQKAAHSNETIDRNHLKFIQLDQMAEYANKMLTDRMQAEEAIKENENKFHHLFDFSPQAIALTEVETGQLVDVNNKLCELTHYSREELIGRTTNEMEFYSVPDRERFIHALQSSGQVNGLEMKFKAKNGAHLDALMFARFLEISGKALILTIFNDISDRKRLEDDLRRAQRLESIGTLAGGVAHDFNNLLFPIIAMAEMLLEDIPKNSVEHGYIKEIYKAGNRASDLVKQILAFSRRSEHKLIPVQIQKILREALKLSRSTIPTSVEIVDEIQDDCAMVLADPTQIHQIAMNLITNAYHAVDKHGGQIMVRLAEAANDDGDRSAQPIESIRYAVLSVADTGCGIDPSILDKIFEPYFTTKEKGKGTGLGLSVVYGIIKEHGGDIKVHSDVGKGTTIKVFLPLIMDSSDLLPDKEAETAQTGTEKILLVDDDEIIAALEKQILERLGYDVNIRTSSVEALEAFRANPNLYDLVITDMTMPNMTGDQLTRQLISIRPGIPIIICTGFSEKINAESARAMGVKGFLMKPVVKMEMARMVRQILDEKKTRTKK
ncbi:hypothetical protein DSCO28_10840 [Desulfosarcina ovata subsp. sediminis]|uniref:histidine kinase n=1 Tax=Desulfosarcina ovata subsp. sediminis TaxID=885957 RepID=A0A5K7ZEE1_9BACT|nr:cache domain-containing protein [Desulfosarcina ovata]BBO80518.1 hypothetical protein DSCO28_10840 [Desulfosarcina ovata subsp. sediminis]